MMADLDFLTAYWRENARDEAPAQLDASTLTQLLEYKAEDVRHEARRRLRREAFLYLPMLFASIAGLADGFTVRKLLLMSGVAIVLGGIVITLWHAERRLANLTFGRSVRDTLTALVSMLDAAGRAYLAAYVAAFVVTVAIVANIVWFRYGLDARFVGTLLIGGGAILWSYWSGRAYVERLFRKYRAELADCLRQLQSHEEGS